MQADYLLTKNRNVFICKLSITYLMKHIGWCLDRIQIVLMKMPQEVNSPIQKTLAMVLIDEVNKYAITLTEIITNPKFKKSLNQLEQASVEGVKLQAHEIEKLLKDFEHMLQVLELYIKNLKDIIINHPEQWHSKAKDLIEVIDQKFGGEKGELRKEFEIALHKEQELKEIISSERHLAEFLKL